MKLPTFRELRFNIGLICMRIGIWILPDGSRHINYWLKVVAVIKQERDK